MPEPRWGNMYGEKAVEPNLYDVLRDNKQLRDRVNYLEAALKDAAESEAKSKMLGSAAHHSVLDYWPWLLYILACFGLPAFLYLAAREGGLVQ